MHVHFKRLISSLIQQILVKLGPPVVAGDMAVNKTDGTLPCGADNLVAEADNMRKHNKSIEGPC